MKDGIRETVESIVIAFVLAFLFRTFEAEAFVIPTGSMATTLRGQHKDLRCANCRFPFLVSASEEEPSENDAIGLSNQQIANYKFEHEVVSCVCPNCGFAMDFEARSPTSFKGDRILVGKFAYEFGDPKRWDVAVFHYPHGARTNYIKRLVGLPNETVVIHRGDLLTTAEHLPRATLSANEVESMQRAGTLELQRKPPDKVQAMLQIVYDNDFARPEAPARWQGDPPAETNWTPSDDGKSFETDGGAAHDEMLVYQHFMPLPDFWKPEPGGGAKYNPANARRHLILDFYGYNGGTIRSPHQNGPDYGQCWVSDLALDCRVIIANGEGELVLGLVEANCLFECRIDVATGEARFSSSVDPSFQLTVATSVRGPGKHRLQFANVDDQLLLWVDGHPLPFDGHFEPLDRHFPGDEDLKPVRFGSRGAAVRVEHLRVFSDIYYRAAYANDHRYEDYGAESGIFLEDNRHQWHTFQNAKAVRFELGPDMFLMLGDNSPKSSDSRYWPAHEYYVRRDLLIGKALWIYWPHALDHLPRTEVWFPFFPDFGRMGLVR